MSIGNKLRFEVFKRDDFTCQYCGRKTPEIILQIDHVIPRVEGGTDDFENLISSCFECNSGKGAGLLDNIMKDKDIGEEAVLLAEREMQLAEYNYVRAKIREREDKEIEMLRENFTEQFDRSGDKEWAPRVFPVSFVRFALKKMSYLDILDLVEYAVQRTAESDRGDYPTVAAAKYLVGILKNKLKESTDAARPDN